MKAPRRDERSTARLRQLVTERRTSDEQGFTEFVEQSLPEALADVIDQVRDEWDGSPFFVLAIPEQRSATRPVRFGV
ncbi:MAG: hypothetical protein ACREON_07435 [Gemmatimonadaceae bacterium]